MNPWQQLAAYTAPEPKRPVGRPRTKETTPTQAKNDDQELQWSAICDALQQGEEPELHCTHAGTRALYMWAKRNRNITIYYRTIREDVMKFSLIPQRPGAGNRR